MPESLGLTAYRIVQEATTNFLKHAGTTATARVDITYRADGIDITVTDDGVGALSRPDGRGSGLAGMRERVAAMGGKLDAGPAPAVATRCGLSCRCRVDLGRAG
ncbi:hypothetical protein G7085_10400 [Tessaracoccus sp. HDW20]|uniref:sensor histidine kinase n=1 Tax=Tessaracoccus coleopterorum TaxID=2714950 RepID=UPI0018D395F4|nr:ATP-binding protein [Tessaracoccus coleopterorum]NHB84877.1 hypothetical protein [Tessaracoccus coleopterorum]